MIEKLVSIDIETTPIDPITKDIHKLWCICLAWKESGKIETDEIVFSDGITKEDLVLKKVDEETKDKLYFLQDILNNKDGMIPVFHGSHFEYRHLTESGFSIKRFHDSQILGYVLYPRYESHSLEAWGNREYCDEKAYADVDVDEFFGTFKREIVDRCLSDVKSTLQLSLKLKDELKEDDRAYQLYENMDIPFVPVLVDMCRNGVHVDGDKLTEFTIEVESELEKKRDDIWSIVPAAPGPKKSRVSPIQSDQLAHFNSEGMLDEDQIGKYLHVGVERKLDKNLGFKRPYKIYRKVVQFNPGSSDQKVWALYTNDGFISEEVSDKTGKPKADTFALEEASVKGSKLAEHILEFQKLNKLYTSFCIPLQNKRDVNGRIYANFNNTVTATGRLSCSEPNLQQIPIRNELGAKLRNCITPEDDQHVIIDIDLSGAEMRILGWYQVKLVGDDYDDAWVIWNAAHNQQDLHKPTIDMLGLDPDKERIVAKTLSFGDMYGMGMFRFARTLKCTLDKAKGYLKLRHDNMPSINALKKVVWDIARNRPDHTIHTLYGRRLTYRDIVHSEGHKRARAERQIFNGLIQGTQGDLLKIIMLEVFNLIKEAGAKLIMQVHDEIVIECPKGTAEWLANKLEEHFNRSDLLPGLPLVGEAHIADSWGEAHG